MQRVQGLCRARGMRVLVALHTNRRAYLGDDSPLEPFLLNPDASAPETLDLRAYYARAGLSWDELALDKLGHLRPRGHDEAARALAVALAR